MTPDDLRAIRARHEEREKQGPNMTGDAAIQWHDDTAALLDEVKGLRGDVRAAEQEVDRG